MANLLIVNSSYRKNSNSTELGARIATGAKEAGHAVTSVDISHLRIEPCRGCYSCMKPNARGCVIKDDMQPLYPDVVRADIIVFAAPVYWFNICGQAKQFIDRCFAVAVNPTGGPSPFAAKKIGAVLTFGGADIFDSGGVNAIRAFQDICAFCGAQWAGACYAKVEEPGEALKDAALLEKARQYGSAL